MQGDLVIVRAYGGQPLVRRVWDEGDRVVYITDETQFKLLKEGKAALEPVGFPSEDVFSYNERIAESMEEKCRDGGWSWDVLGHFRE